MATVERERSTEARRAQTMRAAVVEDFTRPLVLKDVPRPSAGAGEIVVRVETPVSVTPTSTRRVVGVRDAFD
jgi:hypothetical protein